MGRTFPFPVMATELVFLVWKLIGGELERSEDGAVMCMGCSSAGTHHPLLESPTQSGVNSSVENDFVVHGSTHTAYC